MLTMVAERWALVKDGKPKGNRRSFRFGRDDNALLGFWVPILDTGKEPLE
jgi:hypothetical protein